MSNYHEAQKTDALLDRFIDRYAVKRRPISIQFRDIISCLPSIDRFTHLIHPYPAKLLLHIPFFFLANRILSKPGDAVLDPFCGSGTVLLESMLAGRRALGAESSPIARLITSVKTTPLNAANIERHAACLLSRVPKVPTKSLPDVVNINHWFYPKTIDRLRCIREAISETEDQRLKDFFSVCFSCAVRKVSLADPRLAVPVRVREGRYPDGHALKAKSDRHCRELRHVNAQAVFSDAVAGNIKRMAQLESRAESLPDARIVSWDARHLQKVDNSDSRKGLKDRSVHLIITSPPYPGAQKYIRSLSLSIGWLGLCDSTELLALKRGTIGREEFRKSEWLDLNRTGVIAADKHLKQIYNLNPVRAAIASAYLLEMRESLREMYRVLKPGGHLVLIASNNQICGREFRTQDYLRRMAEEVGFETILRMIDSIRSRGLMTKRNRTASVITREWVLVFRKG
jgi:DNA modification methylase